VSGAVCSSKITARKGVGIQEFEIPAFQADLKYKVNGTPFLEIEPNKTVFSVWIGTNDVGVDAFLTNNQQPGKTLNDFVNCVYKTFDEVYKAGGRKFVLMNLIPLDRVPLYASLDRGGLRWSKYWTNKPANNVNQINSQMNQIISTVNTAFKNQTTSIMQKNLRYPGATMALFDTWALV
jgi:hypothetical protein